MCDASAQAAIAVRQKLEEVVEELEGLQQGKDNLRSAKEKVDKQLRAARVERELAAVHELSKLI